MAPPSPIESALAAQQWLESACDGVSVTDLADQLGRWELVDRSTLASVLRELEQGSLALNSHLLAETLLTLGKVSAYQIAAVLSGQPERLTLGEYLVIEPLGAGGMGEVLLAKHRRMQREVALKIVPAHLAADGDIIKRFEREVAVAAQLIHPHIVTAYDAGEAQGRHFLVMEYVAGCDLASLLRARGPLTLEDSLRCVIQASRGLAHAHAKGVIHRDVKPGNLLLNREGGVKVLDLGLASWKASIEQSRTELSSTGMVMGTVDYMSPEQAEDAKKADHRSDIYSLGCTLYALAHNRPVFERESLVSKILAHQNSPPPRFSEETGEKAEALNEVFQRLVAKSPVDRLQSMAEVEAALRAFLPTEDDLRVTAEVPRRNVSPTHALLDTVNGVRLASLATTRPGLRSEAQPAAEPTPRRGLRTLGAVAILLLATAGLWRGWGATNSWWNNAADAAKGDSPISPRRDGAAAASAPPRLGEQTRPPVVRTVAQDGKSGQYDSINAALRDAQPGDTIRILDDAVYREVCNINDGRRLQGITLEAVGDARLEDSPGQGHVIMVQSVSGVTMRSLRLRTTQPGGFGFVATGSVDNLVLEDCKFEANAFGAMPQLSLEAIRVESLKSPVVVRNCRFASGGVGIQVSGQAHDYSPLPCGGIVIHGCKFQDVIQPLFTRGALHDLWIVGNVLTGTPTSGVQFMELAPTSTNILVANNSTYRVVGPLRVWALEPYTPADVHVLANVTVGSEVDTWQALQAYDMQTVKGPGDGQSYAEGWRFGRNFREGAPPKSDSPILDGWIPPSPSSVLASEIKLVSREPTEDDYLRPPPDSPVAEGGLGGDFPAYAGAVPPAGAAPPDWERLFAAGRPPTVASSAP